MNFKKVIFSTLLAAGCFIASAQQEVKTEYVFNPHWYGQLQLGMQHTLGEVDFGDLNSFNFQAAVGRQFSPVWGARLTVGGMNSKAGTQLELCGAKETWSWNYIAPTLNATFDVTNAIWGFNPNRKVSFGVFAGAGLNFAWGNDDALTAGNNLANATKKNSLGEQNATAADYVEHLWDDSNMFLVGQFGANLDYKVNDNLSLGIEFSNNIVNDHYNSKHAPNCDWYFNGLVGVKYAFGKTYDVRTTVLEPTTVTEYIHDTIYVEVKVPEVVKERESIRRDIFFVIRGSQVAKSEMPKVEDIVAYLNKYPDAKVSVTGYADKGTGNPKINIGYAEKRANKVADILANQFGISRDRMVVDSKGDTVQPYEQNNLNRVTICIAE